MADAEPSNKPKRRLSAPTPTVRENAEKAQASADKPKKSRRLSSAAQSAGRPLARAGRAFDRQPFRFIGKILKFIGRIIFPKYLRSAFAELRLVTWPGRKETYKLTFAVLAFAVVFGGAIAGVDYGLDKLFKAVLLK